MLSVVIPVYNRLENFKLCMAALEHQKDVEHFEVVVVDDGSTDGLKEWLYETHSNPDYRNGFGTLLDLKYINSLREIELVAPIFYLSGGPNKNRFTAGRARNIGAFNCRGDLIVFLDGEIVLNENALHHYQIAHEASPSVIITGRYHWLPPFEFAGYEEMLWKEPDNYHQFIIDAEEIGLKRKDVNFDGVAGPDHRQRGPEGAPDGYTEDVHASVGNSGLSSLSGNIGYPKDLFWDLGGFDERIIGHGGEDADLGLAAAAHGARWLHYRPIYGWHTWHPRDQRKNARELQANIAFIDAKHGVGAYEGEAKLHDDHDWKDPIHYHAHLGAELVKGSTPTVCVVRENHYLKLSSPRWLVKLGFTWSDLKTVDDGYFEGKTYEGDALDESPQPAKVQQIVVSEKLKNSPIQISSDCPFDKSEPSSYRKYEKATLVHPTNGHTVYSVRDKWAIALTTPEWIDILGFTGDEVIDVPEYALHGIEVVKATPDHKTYLVR